MSSTPWCILELKNRGLVPDLCIDRSSSAVLADLPLAPVAVLDVVVVDYFLVINLCVRNPSISSSVLLLSQLITQLPL